MDRGDIWHVDLEPIRGREQAGARYVLVVTKKSFNAIGTPIVVPITTGGEFARFKGFAVSLSGAGTRSSGVILCNQLRSLDLRARGGKYVESVPDFIMFEVLARITIFFD
ncbi:MULTISPECIES: type II toxin-antitoxin system PemK/MazF family toxin [unclassified Rhizobium]|uniref:type II toxin-antitoxin system PemK/MazF family toxin n=1 Tax=unclassified Rhizobium TaxID=2613769 RepID=UPI00115CAE6A|nr:MULTISPECIES: type II toxin-antitoxin system PemK/MazF family toxin [unclassified Rhizobium]MBZ5760331.1 type II toxin-antitoxin system PemK/MazF family toxin [Rhizobium sp. VS19-DR96]MBZ5766825.1 type II toxin-antitoxin system PemK/MazF family toxin [Rhizobium sp. VS19-DR129.2]MBZ5773182.1 type II toxin-antitoxin system PemK/MazF family toxin [Rhizobium sp. VS19-DRK62.2]MBZ5784166.1 type II toxin-antitoxin system PemK/MazF family toxin [Rhizobium sp. VS19-DR121]MBZ5802526.1 type II toxin-a